MSWKDRGQSHPHSVGFTLIELLMVVAILMLLVALLLPALHVTRKASHIARSRAQFSQWVLAVEGFRQEYGYFPFVQGQGDTAFVMNEGGNRADFESVLSGSNTVLNRRGIAFYQLEDADLLDPSDAMSPLCDAFGNTQLVLLLDGDGDGWIRVAGYELRSRVEVVAVANASAGFPEVRTWTR